MISVIFKWYKNDFERAGTTILEFIYKYASEQVREIIDENGENLKLKYLDYDWSLNVSALEAR